MNIDMIKKLIYVALAAVCLSSCRYDVDEILLSRSDISLTIKGKLQMSFDEMTCQLGYNTDRNEFRVYNDKLTDWFILRCSAKPTSNGQKVTADLEYTTKDDVKTLTGLEFIVQDTSSDGLIWLWDKKKKTGVVVKRL